MFYINFSCKLSDKEKSIYNEKESFHFNDYRYSSSNIQKIFYYFIVEKNRNLHIDYIKNYKKIYEYNESNFSIIKLIILDFMTDDIKYIRLLEFLCDITVSIFIEFHILNNTIIPLSMEWNSSVLFKISKTTIVTNYMFNVFNEIISVIEKNSNYYIIYKRLLLYTKLKILFTKMEDIEDLVNNGEDVKKIDEIYQLTEGVKDTYNKIKVINNSVVIDK